MVLVDTHSHIFFKDYDSDRDDIVKRAEENGVVAIFDVGLEIESNIKVIKAAEKYDQVFPIAGFHPHEAKDFDQPAFADFIEEYAADCVALGEFGLDYFRDHSPHDVQRKVFEQTLEMCIPLGKPLIIHSRAANEDMIAMLRNAGKKIKGVMHCFSGGTPFLEQVMELDMHISVGGPVTYPKNDRLLEVIRRVPAGKLLLETDCPFLTPQFRRGKRNEPSYIPIIAEKIAQERFMSVDDLAELTTGNVIRLFEGRAAQWLENKIVETQS